MKMSAIVAGTTMMKAPAMRLRRKLVREGVMGLLKVNE
jgi:hypothetical protein